MNQTKEACESVRNASRAAEQEIRNVQQNWRVEEGRLRNDAMDLIRGKFDNLERECMDHAAQLFQDAESQFVQKYQVIIIYYNP